MFNMGNDEFQSSNGRERSSAPAVAKAARILDAVASASRAPGVSEISRRTGLSKSTVHGLVGALVDEGLLIAGESRGYVLGPRLVQLGARARDGRLYDAAHLELQALTSSHDATALFGRVDADRVLILAAHQKPGLLNLSVRAGSSVPVLAGALGKAYLGSMTPDRAVAYLAGRPLPRYTERSITNPHDYLEQVSAVRARGYAIERGEYLPGIAAAACAVTWLGATYLVWAIGIDAIYADAHLDELGRAVKDSVSGMVGRLAVSDGRESVRSGV